MLDRLLSLGLRNRTVGCPGVRIAQWIRNCFISEGARASFFLRSRSFLSNTTEERVELPWIASTYPIGMNESGNQKGNLSYLAGTKKRSDSLIEGARAVG